MRWIALLMVGCSTTASEEPADPWAWSVPTLGASEETAALAASRDLCGATPYSWVMSEKLGTISAIRQVSSHEASSVGLIATVAGVTLPREAQFDVIGYQITYWTQERGRLIEATALVAVPQVEVGTELQSLGLLHGTAGFADSCSLSDSAEYHLLAAAYASTLGRVVVMPDFIGMRGDGESTGFIHPYIVGEPTAMASIDAVRALRHLDADTLLGQTVLNHTAFLGYSQGGHAALWVDLFAPHYGPELNIAGIVAGAPPAEWVSEMQRVLSEFQGGTGNAVAFMVAAADWYEGGEHIADALVSPLAEELPVLLATECDENAEIDVDLESLEDVFTPAFIETVSSDGVDGLPFWGCVMGENSLGRTSVPRVGTPAESYGVLWVLGEEDDLLSTTIERAEFVRACESGIPLTYLECAGADHTGSYVESFGEAYDFLEARYAGEPFTPQCVLTEPVTCSGSE